MKLGPDPARDTPTSAPASILSSPCWIPAGLSSVHVPSRAGLSNVSHNFSSMSIVEVDARSAGRAPSASAISAAPFANGFRWSTRYP